MFGSGKIAAGLSTVALLAVAVGSCGESGSGTPSGSGGAPGGPSNAELAKLCEEQAQQICHEQALCTPEEFEYPSLEDCLKIYAENCAASVGMGSFGVSGYGDLGIDWEAYLDCAKKKNALGPSCRPPPNVSAADVEAMREACKPSHIIEPGKRGLGEPCYVELQCQPGLACSANGGNDDGGLCGECIVLNEGATCEHNSDCGLLLGMTCDPTTQTCKKYAQLGEPCDTRTCDPNEFLDCDPDQLCVPLAKEGQSCESVECDVGLFLHCSIVDHVCKSIPKTPGDACETDAVCSGGLFCDFSNYTCKPLLGVGEPCNPSFGNTCETTLGLNCDPGTSTCTSPYAQVGQSCDPNAFPPKECWGSVCVQPGASSAGSCVAWGLEGASCSSSGPSTCSQWLSCVSGVCTSILNLLDSAAYADAYAGSLSEIAPCL